MAPSEKSQETNREVYELRLTPAPFPHDPKAHEGIGHLRVAVPGDRPYGFVKNAVHRVHPMPASALLESREPERFEVHAEFSGLGLRTCDTFEVHCGIVWHTEVTSVRGRRREGEWIHTVDRLAFAPRALARALEQCPPHATGLVVAPTPAEAAEGGYRAELVYAVPGPDGASLRYFRERVHFDECPTFEEVYVAVASGSRGIVAASDPFWTSAGGGWRAGRETEWAAKRLVDDPDLREDAPEVGGGRPRPFTT